MTEKKQEKTDIMKVIARFIVEKRVLFYLLFAGAVIFCALSVDKVKINEDLTAFLPKEAETRQGLTIMEDEFVTYGSARVMVANITYNKAEKLAEKLEKIKGVSEVTFDDTASHYAASSALYTISFSGVATDQKVLDAMSKIKTMLKDYDTYISSEVGVNYSEQLAEEISGVVIVVVAVIVVVLLFTSRSYFEVVIFFMVFGVAAILNMGTNYLLGEISSITNSIAVILQLALAIDYAIIFCHRYEDDRARFDTAKEALIEALSKAIIEISSSSLTTISGLVALTLMQFRLGYDLGVVLSKGILCSLITVFFLMPGLIMLFPRQLERTQHKSLVPDITSWGKFLVKHRFLFSFLFLLLIPPAIYCSGKCEYAFSDKTVDEVRASETRLIEEKIKNTFAEEATIAVLIPRGNYEKEKKVLAEVSRLDNVSSATGLANTEIKDGYMLTDKVTPHEFAELLNIDVEQATLLYQAYGLSNENYQPVFNDASTYSVPLVDMFLFLIDMTDQGVITLDDETMDELEDLKVSLNQGLDQLRGKKWCRLVFVAAVPEEGKESNILIDDIRKTTEKYYNGDRILVVGNITSARDLRMSFSSDNKKINILTIVFVFVILLCTFRSLVGALLLVFAIQGSIWINFSFPFLTNTNISFIAYLIISAIQMGATIDYAIVIMNRYQALKEIISPKDAIAQAVKESFATVLTSGSIMTAAGFLIAYMTTDAYIGSIGLALGRGTLISMILVMTALPQMIYILDKPIEKTTFKFKFGGDQE